MNAFQKWGGIAALINAATFVAALGLFFTVLGPLNTGALDPAGTVAFLLDNRLAADSQILLSYVVFSLFLVVLALALHDRLKGGAPALAQVGAAFGLIWAGLLIASGMVATVGLSTVASLRATDPAAAATVWQAIDVVHRGTGGELEIVGAVWLLLVSLAGLRSRSLPRALNWLGLLLAAAGMLTLVPLLEMLGAVFGLGLIVWFVWLGVALLRAKPAEMAALRAQPARL